jgi:hypothetical protein
MLLMNRTSVEPNAATVPCPIEPPTGRTVNQQQEETGGRVIEINTELLFMVKEDRSTGLTSAGSYLSFI